MSLPTLISTRKPVVAIIGPTAIGKSRIGIEVARSLRTEILTVDSRQVYREMDIGTDKPTLKERQGIPHRLIDLVNPDQPFNVGDFRQHAIRDISRLHAQGQLPLLVGGTGLYLRALLRGLCPGPSTNWGIRKKLEQQAKVYGKEFLYKKLQQVDPELAQRLHPHDQPKILRGLEVYQTLGTPLSHLQQQHQFQGSPYPCLLIGLMMDRQALYHRIEARVEWEIEKGLIQETQRLLNRGYSRDLGSMKGLGYRQFSGYLAGEYSYDEAVRVLKKDTRHFAKRQMTWFRKEPAVQWMPLTEAEIPEQAAVHITTRIQEFLYTLQPSSSLQASQSTSASQTSFG